jgi:hypothetical protein
MLHPALGRSGWHMINDAIVGIADRAVVDRYQESIDLGPHPPGKQLPMFAAIGSSAL